MSYKVTIPDRRKTVVYEEGDLTLVLDATFTGKAVTVFFRHYHTGRLGGDGILSDEDKRRFTPRIISALEEAGYRVTADGDLTFNDRWLPSPHKAG